MQSEEELKALYAKMDDTKLLKALDQLHEYTPLAAVDKRQIGSEQIA